MELNTVFTLGIFLIVVGILGVLMRRNLLVILISIEIAANGVFLLFFASSLMRGNSDGQSLAIIFMAIAAAEAALGLAISVSVFRSIRSVDADKLSELKE